MCKAFVATSEDSVVGADQKGPEFMEKLHESYRTLIVKFNSENATLYKERKASSNYNHFKKFSKYVLKYIAIEESAGEPPSGDSDKEKWLTACKNTFEERHPEAKNLFDSILYCQEFLQESPKWQAFEKTRDIAKLKKRPTGTKKMKQEQSDEKLVKRVLSVSSDEKSKKKHRKNKDAFMSKIGKGMDQVARNMTDNMDQQLLAFCSPKSQKELAKKLMQERIKRMQHERRSASRLVSSVGVSSITCDLGTGSKKNGKSHNNSNDDEEDAESDSSCASSFSLSVSGRLDAIPDSSDAVREKEAGNDEDEDDADDDDESS